VDYYRDHGVLREVDGNQGLKAVTKALLVALNDGQTSTQS
jgi:hypothetical protein